MSGWRLQRGDIFSPKEENKDEDIEFTIVSPTNLSIAVTMVLAAFVRPAMFTVFGFVIKTAFPVAG